MRAISNETDRPPGLRSKELRVTKRFPVGINVTLVCSNIEVISARLQDISHLGCCVHSVRPMAIGTLVTLRAPEMPDAVGWVAWRRGFRHGLDFAHPLPPQFVDSVAQLQEAQGPATDNHSG